MRHDMCHLRHSQADAAQKIRNLFGSVERMAAILEQIIASGMASGEFPLGATLAARLINTACLRFSHPRLIVKFEQDTEPTLDQMIGFCLAAIGYRDKVAQFPSKEGSTSK